MTTDRKHRLTKRQTIWLLLFLSILLRLCLLFADFSFDVNNHIAWAKEAIKFGVFGLYQRPQTEQYATVFPNYPPLAIFLFIIFYLKYQLLFKLFWALNTTVPLFPSKLMSWFDSRATLAGFMKLPGMIFDLLTALIVYQIIKKLIKNNRSSLPTLGAILILFNPAFIYNSSYMGQIEAIPTAFILLSFYWLVFKKNFYWSLPLLTLAFLAKQTAIIFLPVFLIIYIKKKNWRLFTKGILISLGLFMLSFIPFYQLGNPLIFPFQTYTKNILFAFGLPFASNHAYNFWALVTGWKDIKDTMPFLFMTYQLWGYLIVGTLLFVVGYWLLIKKLSVENFLKATAIWGLTVFLFLTKIHSRHLQVALPFLLLAGIKDKYYRWGFVYFSIAYMINLYHNWSVPKIIWLETFIKLPTVVNGFILISLLFYFYLFYRLIFKKS